MKNTTLFWIPIAFYLGILFHKKRITAPITKTVTSYVYITPESIDNKFSTENLYQYIKALGIQHTDIVYKQAILETGHFTSKAFKIKNNLFGFTYNSTLISFANWKESVRYYANWQLRKYKKGDYYTFLKDIGYAQDTLYIHKLKNL